MNRNKYLLTACFCSITVLTSGCAYNQYMDAEKAKTDRLNHQLTGAETDRIISEQEKHVLLQERKRLKTQIKQRKQEVRQLELQLQQELNEITKRQEEARQLGQLGATLHKEKQKIRQEMEAKIRGKRAEIKNKEKDLEALDEGFIY